MDVLDMRILRGLGTKPFDRHPRSLEEAKPSALAVALEVSVQTVRERIERMQSSGILAGYEVYPNLRHLGLEWVTYHYKVDPARKVQAVKDMSAIEGIAGTIDFLGPDLCVDVYFRDEAELQRRLRLVSTLTGGAPSLEFYRRNMPPVPRPLSIMDWRILRAMRGQAHRPLRDAAAELGVSSRTIKNRWERMKAERAVDIVPLLDFSKMEGLLPFGLACFIRGADAQGVQRALRAAFDERYLAAWQPPSPEAGHFDLSLFARSPAEVEQLRRQAEGVPGVERAEALLPCGAWENSAWLDEAIERRIKELAT